MGFRDGLKLTPPLLLIQPYPGFQVYPSGDRVKVEKDERGGGNV